MKLLAPGFREVSRLLGRSVRRLRLFRERRRLARLETALGLLGWQQADYDTATQQHADRITDYERTQSQLSNESAAQAAAIQQIEQDRAEARKIFTEESARRADLQKSLTESAGEHALALAAKKAEGKDLETRISVIDREQNAAEQRYQVLLAKGSKAPETQDEILDLRRRIIALPSEKGQWENKLKRLVVELPDFEGEVERSRAALADSTKAGRDLNAEFEKSENTRLKKIGALQRGKARIEKQIHDLEGAKLSPYREIGRVLADNRVEPMNQPEALIDVLAQREVITAHEAALVESLAASAGENRPLVWKAWLVLGSFLLLLLFVVWFVLEITKYHG